MKTIATLIPILLVLSPLPGAVNAEQSGQSPGQIQTGAQKSDHGLDRDLIRRIPSPQKPPAANEAPKPKDPKYGPVLKVKPQGAQPLPGQPAFQNSPQKRASNFGVLLDGKSGDEEKNTGGKKKLAPVKPQPLQGIEPDEIDAR